VEKSRPERTVGGKEGRGSWESIRISREGVQFFRDETLIRPGTLQIRPFGKKKKASAIKKKKGGDEKDAVTRVSIRRGRGGGGLISGLLEERKN